MKALVLKDEQFVTDANGKRVGVLLDVKTYEHLREAEEELADIHAYDAARPKVEADIKAGRTASPDDYRTKRGPNANEVSPLPARRFHHQGDFQPYEN
jgi:PHD/YefM family antitoxin component YafN of YafNO toxin-antitoxin module